MSISSSSRRPAPSPSASPSASSSDDDDDDDVKGYMQMQGGRITTRPSPSPSLSPAASRSIKKRDWDHGDDDMDDIPMMPDVSIDGVTSLKSAFSPKRNTRAGKSAGAGAGAAATRTIQVSSRVATSISSDLESESQQKVRRRGAEKWGRGSECVRSQPGRYIHTHTHAHIRTHIYARTMPLILQLYFFTRISLFFPVSLTSPRYCKRWVAVVRAMAGRNR